MKQRNIFLAFCILIALIFTGEIAPVWAAQYIPPPDRINFQGVLTGASGQEIPDGDYDMTFTLFSADVDGEEILIESRLASGSGAVSMTGGLVNVLLGEGDITDGAGPGAYTSYLDVFRDYDSVWIEIDVDGETMSDRIEMNAVGWVSNAHTLQGLTVQDFGDGSSLDAPDGEPEDAVNVDSDGDVSIGVSVPQDDLHVLTESSGGVRIESESSEASDLRFRKTGTDQWRMVSEADGSFRVEESGAGDRLVIKNGNVGIDESDPQYDLDVNGDANVFGKIVDSTGSSGSSQQILTSIGTGIQWQNSLGFNDGDWDVTGDDMTFSLPGNVGIGVNSPRSRLTVAGPESDTPGNGAMFRLCSTASINRSFGFRIGATGDHDLFLDGYYGGWSTLLSLTREYGKLGIGVDAPVNHLDVFGGLAIGSSYAGQFTAPSNGLLVEGPVGVGVTEVPSGFSLFSGGNIGLDGDGHLLIPQHSGAYNVLFWDSLCGLAVASGELMYITSGTHSFRRTPTGHETMTLTNGTAGGLHVFGGGGSYFMGKLGLNAQNPKNMLDVGGKMVVGSSYAGSVSGPNQSLLIESCLGIGDINGYRLSVNSGNILVENSSGNDKLKIGLNTDNAGYLQTYGEPSTRNAIITSDEDHANYGLIELYDDEGSIKAEFDACFLEFGKIVTYGPTRSINTTIGCVYPYIDNGMMGVYDENSDSQATMLVDSNGDGVVSADYKWLKWDDPSDESREIRYGCLEGPEAAIYIRGTARLTHGSAHVEFPEHFADIASNENATVQLTPLDPASKGLAVTATDNTGFSVKELRDGDGDYEFDWEARCVREKYTDYQVVRAKTEGGLK